MKKFFALFALILFAVTPLCLVGCKSKYDNLAIEMEDQYTIVLGQDEDNSITVQAKVTGGSDENGSKLSFSPDNERIVKISQEYRSGINYITLKALAPGKVNVEARTLEGGATKNFVVNIIQPIKNFTVKDGDFVVVRGGQWTIDVEKNLDLEPTNTTQTNFSVSFAQNQDVLGLNIQDNILTVSKSFGKDEIVLSVSSTDNPEIAPKEIKLEVLDEFVEIDKQTQASQSTFAAGDILVFEKNESMLSQDKLEEVNIVSNLVSESEKQIVVRVYSTREVDVSAVANSRLSVKKISTLDYLDASGKLQYVDFVFSVRFADIVSSGTTSNLDFVVKYADFDLSTQLSSIKVAYELAPKTLLINDQDDLDEFTLYNFYSTAKKGQRLQFGVLPSSVSAKNSRMVLLSKDNLVNAFDYVQFFRSNGEELFEGDEISANETIYARAKSGVVTGSFEVVLQTKFVDPETKAPIAKVLTFHVLAGITEMNFADEDQLNIQLNSDQNYATINFDVKPANVDLTKIHIEEVDGLNFSTIATQSQGSDVTRLKFVVEAQKVGNFNIKVYSENGIEITKKINVVNALESVVLSAPSPNENSVVGDRQIINGGLYRVSISLGGSINLGQTISPEDAKYRVEYSYFEAMPEYVLSSYDYPNSVSSTSMGVLDYSQLMGYGKIVSLKEGWAVIRAKYVPIGIVDNVETELDTEIYGYFVVQVYKPIKSIIMSSNYETLYSLESVGTYNKHLTMTKFDLNIYPSDATYAESIVWTYDQSGEYFDFDEEALTVSVFRRPAGTVLITATIKELNRTYSQTLSINVVDAKMVSSIALNGVSESEIYIENTGDTQISYPINATAFPVDAFNTKLRYDFVDASDNVVSEITFSDDGTMTIPAGVGYFGYVRIAAEDCFQENLSTGKIEPMGTVGQNIIMIPTTIANGSSKETAINIYSKDELKNIDTKKHYRICVDNLDVSGISFETISGGLYGQNDSRTVLYRIDKTFIKNLSKSGRVEDFTLDCDIELVGSTGVLIGQNEGSVNNVVAKGKWSGSLSLVKTNYGKIYDVISEVEFEGDNFAGIAEINAGEIYNCVFRGSIVASNQAAGIVISNQGLVDYCATLLLDQSKIELSSNADAQARIAGVCVENKSGGKIIRSYVHSYRNRQGFLASDMTKLSAFVFVNNGTIQKCFTALTESDEVVGFVNNNVTGAKIENCYSNTTFASLNTGEIKNCYSVLNDGVLNDATNCYSGTSVTEKKVSDWLKTSWDISCEYQSSAIWKIYLDSQNPFLREISAEVKPESLSVSVNEPKSTNSYIKINDMQVVLYYYESQVAPLSVAEKARLGGLNSIAIYDLLTYEVAPFNASSSPDMFELKLSEGEALEISGLSIVVKGLGKQTLTVTSILNPELSWDVTIYTSYPLRDFNVFASSSSLDPSGALTNGSTIYLKRTYTQPLYSKVANSITLVDREIEYKTFDLKMDYDFEDELQELGLFILMFDEKQKIDYSCGLNFDDVLPYEEFSEIKGALSSIFERTFEIVVYNGAESMVVSQNSLEMEPIDVIQLGVEVVSDYPYGEDEVVKYEIYNSKGMNLTEYFKVDYSCEKSEADEKGFVTYEVTLTISLSAPTTQISGDYYIRVYANEDNTTFSLEPIDVTFKLLPQSVQRIDYAHYYAQSTIETTQERVKQEVLKSDSSPSNALAPGQVGLLEINLFPTYSEISHVEIESIPNQGYTVKFQLYKRQDVNVLNKFVMVQQNVDYSRTENGIVVGYTMITNGTIYVKTQVDSNIPSELTFEIVVRAYRSEDDLDPVVQHVFLAAKFVPSAKIEIDGQSDYVVMGRGTTKDMTITVVGEGDVDVFVDGGANEQLYSYDRVYVGQKTLTSSKNLGTQNQYVWTCPIAVGSRYENAETNDVAIIRVVVSREVNGVKERKETLLTVRVLDFVVSDVVLSNGTNQYSSKVSVKTKFEFSFEIAEPQAFTNEEGDTEAVAKLKEKIENFKKAQYFTSITNGTNDTYTYKKSFMFVDSLGDHTAATETNDGYRYAENGYVEFGDVKNSDGTYAYTIVTGRKTGTQKMKLKVASTSTSDGNTSEVYSITYEFDIVVTNYSNEDKPLIIGSLDDFNAIFEQEEAQDYILTSDIEIYNHVIYSDTSKIRSLDGNNHKIIIKSLNLGENQTLDVALFDTISEISTIKNLIVDYQIGEIGANSDQFSSINVAGLALANEGIVTNTHVLSSKGTSTQTTGGLQISSSVSQSTQIQMAGFVLENSGSITNSRVGDTSVTIVDTNGSASEQSLKVFAMVGQDQMAGFVLENSGIISASFAKNISITNNSNFSTDTKTAGFVLSNLANAKITGCYVRGVESSDQTGVYVLGDGIDSSFEVAGFVFDNYSYISDCYSNIKLYKETLTENRVGTRSAGFVFNNYVGAQIVSSLSLSKIIEDDTSHENFCGVDSENQSNNKGTITYSYYYSLKGKLQSVADGAKLLDATAIKQEDHFYGYVFTSLGALDGMWNMTSRGPELISANNIAISKRYALSLEEDIYDIAYVAGYEYGSANNPILIRSAIEFNEVFGTSKDDSIKNYFDADAKQAFGNYRIINDIDLSDLTLGGDTTAQISSTSYTLMKKTDKFGGVVGLGVIEGNSMTISNLDFSIAETKQTSVGLFSSIQNGAVVKNLNLTVKGISASSVNYVGALAGYVDDSKIINVTAGIAQGQQVALVQGLNIVGGVVGVVSGTSVLNNVVSNISALANYVDTKEINKVNTKDEVYVQAANPTLPTETSGTNRLVSIAGSVAGAVYAEDINDADNKNLSTIDFAQVQKIKASGKITVSAKIAGGLIGYVGKTTYVHDAWFAISDGQSINAHEGGVAGGAIGLSCGKLSHVRVEHNDVQDYSDEAESVQTEIEASVVDYYNGKSNDRKTYENMFKSSSVGQTLGGIVGVMNGGILEDSYTKLDVISDNAYNLGGIVGIIKNQKYEISRVYTFSNVQSKSTEKNVLVGGLFGAVLSSGELDTVVGANYLDKNYTTYDGKYVAFAPFAGACTYTPNMANVFVLSSIWGHADEWQKIAGNTGAEITGKKTVDTLTTSLDELFPAQTNAAQVNEVFEIEDSHFKNIFWARNVDDVLPHLTFELEEKYFIIDSINTAQDIREMIKNSNKTFYIDGKVDLGNDQTIRNAIQDVRDSIIFTGTLMGIPDEMATDPDVQPTLIGLQELFSSAVGATFADFCIEEPQTSANDLPTLNGGGLVGNAKDCQFRDIKICDNSSFQGKFKSADKSGDANFGGLVGLAEGKTSFENITVEDLGIVTGSEANVGLIAGQTKSSINETIFKDCVIKDCKISGGSNSTNTNVGAFVGLAGSGVTITSSNSTSTIKDVVIDVNAQYVGGLVGKCSGTLNLNKMSIGGIEIKCGDPSATSTTSAIAVGGLVGQAKGLSITTNLDIILTNSTNDDYGKIQVNSSQNTIYVGGIVGNVENSLTLSNNASQYIKFQTNDMSVNATTSDATVYAGGIVGNVGNINIERFKVNTQGKIKNKVLAISCAGSTVAGGLVGKAENVQISDCWSGTDVEISDVTKSTGTNNGSCVTFGGIVGEVTKATSSSTDGNIKTSISENVSYGRFYLDTDCNINTINAGGIVGSITRDTSEQQSLTAITSNKTLTSLEIRRQATNHNVNAVAGSLNNVTGSGNAYTYQLSLAVESDTNFATNCSTLDGVGVSGEDAESGSILNPFTNLHIDQSGYYSLREGDNVSFAQNFDGEYVLIGNGKSISFTNSHLDKVGKRTIISGVTVEGKFDYSESSGEATVTLGGTKYIYSSSGLTPAEGGTEQKYTTTYSIDEWQDVTETSSTVYYFEDGTDKIYVEINENKKIEVNSKDYYIYGNYAIDKDNDKVYTYSTITEYSSGLGNFETKDLCCGYVDEDTIYEVKERDDETLYYEKGTEIITISDNTYIVTYVTLNETKYILIYDDNTLYLELSKDNLKKQNKVSVEEKYEISSEGRKLEKSEDVILTLDGSTVIKTGGTITIGSITYDRATIDGKDYVIKTNNTTNKTQVAKISSTRTITLNGKTYKVSGRSFSEKKTILSISYWGIVATARGAGSYETSQGFVRENNGYICGVVVKSNYSSSGFGGFVTTNNGAIKYSSMNGQVYNTSSDTNVAGFVLENNGIIDYCHSTGAVQGSATNSYSFGVNASTGALTNSYTIMLNETTNTISSKAKAIVGPNTGGVGGNTSSSTMGGSDGKYVFVNKDGTFLGNEYDPVGTETDIPEKEIDGLSNDLTGVIYTNNNQDTSIINGYWNTIKIKSPISENNAKTYYMSYNYGYKTLSAGPFNDIEHLKMATGSGSTGDPFIIANSRMLSKIDQIGLGCSYTLSNNIDLSKNNDTATNWGNIGLTTAYSGIFDGNNKTISNLKFESIDSSDTSIYGGLFAKVSNATIQNLILNNFKISISKRSKDGQIYCYAGALAAYSNGLTAENLFVDEAEINSYCDYEAYAGGLIGYAKGSLSCSSINVSNSTITSKNTYDYINSDQQKSKKWIGFDKEDDAKKHVSYASSGVGNNKIDITNNENKVNAYIVEVNKYDKAKDGDDFDFTDFINEIVFEDANTSYNYLMLDYDSTIWKTKYSACYSCNNKELKYEATTYRIWTDGTHGSSDRYNNLDGTILVNKCGVRDFSALWTGLGDQNIAKADNWKGVWEYHDSFELIQSGVWNYIWESSKNKKLFYKFLGNYFVITTDHMIWIDTSYVNWKTEACTVAESK